MFDVAQCAICKSQAKRGGSTVHGKHEYMCSRCGNYAAYHESSLILDHLEPAQIALLSGWVRDQNDFGDFPDLDKQTLNRVLSMRPKEISERIDRMLSWAISQQKTLDQSFNYGSPALVAKTYSQSLREVGFLVNFLGDQGLMKELTSAGQWQVTPEGFIEHSKVGQNTESRTAFIAMWFHLDMRDARNTGIMDGISKAGFEPIVIDDVEHNRKIDDEIIAAIRKARFLVADFTGHRGGVYFEAGFAMGLGLPVIWTCRQDELEKLHFDIRQYNCINWSSPTDLSQRLQRRIEAVIGQGPLLVS